MHRPIEAGRHLASETMVSNRYNVFESIDDFPSIEGVQDEKTVTKKMPRVSRWSQTKDSMRSRCDRYQEGVEKWKKTEEGTFVLPPGGRGGIHGMKAEDMNMSWKKGVVGIKSDVKGSKDAKDDEDDKDEKDENDEEAKDIPKLAGREATESTCGGTCRAWASHVVAPAALGGQIRPILTIEPESLNAFSKDGVWEEIEMAVDSGATETVANDGMLSSIPTEPGPASKRGVEYEVANGTRIPNEGEMRFEAVTGEGQHRKLVVQVCDVNQGLLSVSKATAANNRVVFDKDGSYIENKDSGEVTWLEEKKGMYMLKLWVRKRPF